MKLDIEILNKKYKNLKTKYKNAINDNNCLLNYESKQNIILNSLENSIDLISSHLYISTMRASEKINKTNSKTMETETKTTNKKQNKSTNNEVKTKIKISNFH